MFDGTAPAPSRSYDTGRIVIGMTSMQVSIFTATTERSSETKQFSPAGNPIGNRRIDKVTGEEVAFSDIVSMHQTEHGPVAIDPAETEDLLQVTPKTITLTSFMPHQQALESFLPKAYRTIEPAMVKTSKGKSDDVIAQRQVSALLTAMAAGGLAAFGEFITRGRPYPIVLFSNGLMWEVHYADQIRASRESKLIEVSEADVAKMQAEIEPLIGIPTDLTDRRRDLIQAYAEAKALIVNADQPPTTPEVTIPDLIAVLQASIAAAAERAA